MNVTGDVGIMIAPVHHVHQIGSADFRCDSSAIRDLSYDGGGVDITAVLALVPLLSCREIGSTVCTSATGRDGVTAPVSALICGHRW